MAIAILKTDSLLPQFRDQFGEYPVMLEDLLSTVRSDLRFDTFDVVKGDYPDNPEAFDAFFIMGSKSSVYDSDAWIARLGDYVQQLHRQKRKIIGICFGHQLLAHVLGGKTEKSKKGWGVGVHCSTVLEAQPWMGSALTQFNLLVSHQDQVTRLPKKAVHVAGDGFCEFSMFTLSDRVLGMQGHPEFCTEYARQLMRLRKTVIGEQAYSSGVNSLSKATDERVVAQWMCDFLAI